MYLFIDPSVYTEISITLLFPDREKRVVVTEKNRELLRVIATVLETEGMSPQDISGIVILVGEGSFSSTRIASVIGNACAYALHIPVVGILSNANVTFQSVEAHISRVPVGVYLSPTYSGEPHIGITTST